MGMVAFTLLYITIINTDGNPEADGNQQEGLQDHLWIQRLFSKKNILTIINMVTTVAILHCSWSFAEICVAVLCTAAPVAV